MNFDQKSEISGPIAFRPFFRYLWVVSGAKKSYYRIWRKFWKSESQIFAATTNSTFHHLQLSLTTAVFTLEHHIISSSHHTVQKQPISTWKMVEMQWDPKFPTFGRNSQKLLFYPKKVDFIVVAKNWDSDFRNFPWILKKWLFRPKNCPYTLNSGRNATKPEFLWFWSKLVKMIFGSEKSQNAPWHPILVVMHMP